MRSCALAMFAGLALVLGGCKSTASGDAAAAQQASARATVTISSNGKTHRFNAEVARTPEEQRRGLMYRASLPADGAMLFPFETPRYANFWMKNTQIPLDIIYIRADGSVDRIAENTIPFSEEPILSGGEVVAALEINGGTAARLGIGSDATISWTFDK